MDSNILINSVITLIEGGGLAVFFYYTIKGLKNQVHSQKETLDTMRARIVETEKVTDLYKSMVESLPADIDKFREITTKLKDETIKELQNAYEGKSDKSAGKEMINSIEKLQRIIEKIDLLKESESKEESFNLKYLFSHNYEHSGWHERDIPIDIPVNNGTNVIFKIKLDSVGQNFRVYFKIRTSSGSHFWLGLGQGNNNKHKSRFESTKEIKYSETVIVGIENFMYNFKDGFPEINDNVTRLTTIRLRGDDNNKNKINFSFGIIS